MGGEPLARLPSLRRGPIGVQHQLKGSTQPIVRDNPANSLAPHHRAMLEQGSGISPEKIRDRGYFTVTDTEDLRELGFAYYQLIFRGALPRDPHTPALETVLRQG